MTQTDDEFTKGITMAKSKHNMNGQSIYGEYTPFILNAAKQLTENARTLRNGVLRTLDDPRRSIPDECGFPAEDSYIEPIWYQSQYEINPIAARAIEAKPREMWQVQPKVFEVEDAAVSTPFEEAWDRLGRTLRGKSWYQDEEGNPIVDYWIRADIESRIGQYALIYLGFDDIINGGNPSQPVTEGSATKLLYMRVIPEVNAPISRLDRSPGPRYGQPLEYTITFNDSGYNQSSGIVPIETQTSTVHYTRVIHIAEGAEVLARPVLCSIREQILGLRKLYAASPEGYWKACLTILAAETHPQLGGDVDINTSDMKDMFENMMNGLQRYGVFSGMSLKSIAPSVVDPTPHIKSLIEAICIRLGIPMRIFMGSERGELASSQDDVAWNDRLKERQMNYATPRIIVPFVDRLIWSGVLPEPKGYSVWWPDLTSQSDQEKAQVASTRTNALVSYVQGGVEALVPPLDFLTRIMGMDDEEAQAVLDSATEAPQDDGLEQPTEGTDDEEQPTEGRPNTDTDPASEDERGGST